MWNVFQFAESWHSETSAVPATIRLIWHEFNRELLHWIRIEL